MARFCVGLACWRWLCCLPACRGTLALSQLRELNCCRPAAVALPCCCAAARLDTAKLVKDSLEQSPKAVVIKCKDSLLPVAAAACSDADASIREVAQGIVAVFAVKAGSMAIIDKVGVLNHCPFGAAWEAMSRHGSCIRPITSTMS